MQERFSRSDVAVTESCSKYSTDTLGGGDLDVFLWFSLYTVTLVSFGVRPLRTHEEEKKDIDDALVRGKEGVFPSFHLSRVSIFSLRPFVCHVALGRGTGERRKIGSG